MGIKPIGNLIGKLKITRPGVDKVKPKVCFKYSLQITNRNSEQCRTVPPYSYPHGRPASGPSCTEFDYPGCLHFDNGATSKNDDVLTEHGGLLWNGVGLRGFGDKVFGTGLDS